MHRSFAAAALILALAGCGSDKAPKTADEVVAEAGELVQPRAGLYATNVKMVDFSVPGLPPQQAEQIRTMMGGAEQQASSYCLTPEEAKKGFGDSIRKMTEGKGGMKCEFKHFDVNGNQLDAELACTAPQGMNSVIAMTGTATAESSDMTMKMTQKAAMIPGGEMNMEMQMSSKRTGDCPA